MRARLIYRSAGACQIRSGRMRCARQYAASTVARGPVPRERSRTPEPGEGQALALRERATFFSSTVARGPVEYDRVSYALCQAIRRIYRSAGACPPRTLAYPRAWRGTGPFGLWRARTTEGACAGGMARDRPSPYVKGKAFFSSHRGACHRDVERVRKHPHFNVRRTGDIKKFDI